MVYFWDNKSSYFCASSHPELTWQLPNQERQLSIPATAQIQKKKLGGEGCYYVLPSSAPSGYHSAQSQTWRVPPPVGRRHPCPPCLPSPAQFFRALWIAVLVFSLHKHNHHSHRCVDLVFSLNTHNHCSYRHAMLVFSLHKHNHHSHRCVDLVFILNTHNHCSHRHAMSVFSLVMV